MTAIFMMAAEPLKITVKNAALKGGGRKGLLKIRTFSSFILTEIARIWFRALLCHVNIKLFLMKYQGYDIIDLYFL